MSQYYNEEDILLEKNSSIIWDFDNNINNNLYNNNETWENIYFDIKPNHFNTFKKIRIVKESKWNKITPNNQDWKWWWWVKTECIHKCDEEIFKDKIYVDCFTKDNVSEYLCRNQYCNVYYKVFNLWFDNSYDWDNYQDYIYNYLYVNSLNVDDNTKFINNYYNLIYQAWDIDDA